MNRPEIESPCIGVCAINAELGVCVGCQRTVDEIGDWLQYSAAQRRAIMADLERRRVAFEAAAEHDD
ncbi:MAG: DUF1289 domain-containing protein [Gammaproteobacteria bacterium]